MLVVPVAGRLGWSKLLGGFFFVILPFGKCQDFVAFSIYHMLVHFHQPQVHRAAMVTVPVLQPASALSFTEKKEEAQQHTGPCHSELFLLMGCIDSSALPSSSSRSSSVQFLWVLVVHPWMVLSNASSYSNALTHVGTNSKISPQELRREVCRKVRITVGTARRIAACVTMYSSYHTPCDVGAHRAGVWRGSGRSAVLRAVVLCWVDFWFRFLGVAGLGLPSPCNGVT